MVVKGQYLWTIYASYMRFEFKNEKVNCHCNAQFSACMLIMILFLTAFVKQSPATRHSPNPVVIVNPSSRCIYAIIVFLR